MQSECCRGVSAIYAGLSVWDCGQSARAVCLTLHGGTAEFAGEVLVLWCHRRASRVEQPLAHTLLYHTVGYV